MATITVTKLHCIRNQDVSGDDEPLVYLAGQFAWEGKMDKDQDPWDYPDVHRGFSPSILVQLKEKNGSSRSNAKVLGSWTVYDVPATNRMVTASSSGYHYELFYDVT